MEKKVTSGITLTLLITGMLTLAFNIQPVKASGTIYVRADGSVEPSTAPISSFDNVTYTFTDNINDNIVVERDNIVLDGAGFTVQGTGSGIGINMTWRSNVTIENVEIKAFDHGIYLYWSSNNAISGNSITENNWNGICLYWSSNNAISGNNITENSGDGICLYWSSNYNAISGNNITQNQYGIRLYWSSGNTLRNNHMGSNWFNFGVFGQELAHFIHDVDSSNTVAGKPVYYWVSQQNRMVPADAGCVTLVNSTNITVQNLDLENNRQGLLIAYTGNSLITGNNITNNGCGIELISSSNNAISGNNITQNQYGISLLSSNNVICHNNFIDNPRQAWSEESTNIWDDGYPSGGNYWSDYTGVDEKSGPRQQRHGSDGIGDTLYVIDENNQDNYPLVRPFPCPVARARKAIQELIETIETWSLPEGIESSLTSKPEGALHLLDMGKESDAVHKLTCFIKQVEAKRDRKLTIVQADYLIAEAQRIIDLIEEQTP